MTPTRTLLIASLAAAGMVATTVQAQNHASRSGASGAARITHSGSHWNGARGASWGGRHGGGHWGGHRHWHGGARWGFYLGAPIVFSSLYWGWPYYYDYYYPRSTVIYDRVIERYPASYPEGAIGPAETTQIAPDAPGAPTQAPTYMNYCESAKAYYPKVTACPEGWKFIRPR